MTPAVTVSAPANLLLMGEYAVLEEGGLGLAVAPDIRVTGTARIPGAGGVITDLRDAPGSRRGISIVGRLPGATVRWPAIAKEGQVGGLLALAAERLAELYPTTETDIQIDLESRAFFTTDGQKRGFGSSAAIVVALTALWLRTTEYLPDDPGDANALIFHIAVEAHRAGQHGKGSGYDVGSSTFGGVILFTGGARPLARRIALPWLPQMHIIGGSAPVNTVNAVGEYDAWKRASPLGARAYLDESNRLVTAFAEALNWNSAAAILAEYRELALELGATIGVPAKMDRPAWVHGEQAIVKAVGAGNELGVVLTAESPQQGERGTNPQIRLSDEGLTWS